jgi:hypothetical protein
MFGTSQRRMHGVVSTRVLNPNHRQITMRVDSRALSRLTGPAKKSSESSIFDPPRNTAMGFMPRP